MEDWIIIGEIINTKGIKGELKIRPETDYPDRFLDMKELLIQTGKTVKPYPIERVYLHKNMVFCKVTGIETPEEADRFRGSLCVVDINDTVPLPEDTYFIFDLIGCKVYTMQEEYCGVVEDVIQNPANDIYVVRNGEKEALIPAVKVFVKEIDIQNKRILIDPIKGML